MMLVPVPWQPALMVHRDLLVKLEQIKKLMGRPPMLYGDASGWRSYEVQLEKWRKFLAGGNPASNPDSPTSPNTHMRGVASDLADTSLRMQAACVAVGLQRDRAEAWHWQLRNWRDYPIIPTLPDIEQEIDVKLIRRTGSASDEWSLFHPSLRGPSELERGYLVVKDEAVARGLARTWADGFGNEKSEPRDVYVELQAAARWAYDQNVVTSAGVDLSPVLSAIAGVPTAEANGAAARKAIVA